MQKNDLADKQPWWKFGHVWLVISGPVSVVVACIITAFFIASSPNELVTDDTYRQMMEQKKAQGGKFLTGGDSPAMQARNHAATGVVPLPKE